MPIPPATGPVSKDPNGARAYYYESKIFQAFLDTHECLVAAEKLRASDCNGRKYSTKYPSKVHFVFKTYEEGRTIRKQMLELDPQAQASLIILKDAQLDIAGYRFGSTEAQARPSVTLKDVEYDINEEERIHLTKSAEVLENWLQQKRNPDLFAEIQQNGKELLNAMAELQKRGLATADNNITHGPQLAG